MFGFIKILTTDMMQLHQHFDQKISFTYNDLSTVHKPLIKCINCTSYILSTLTASNSRPAYQPADLPAILGVCLPNPKPALPDYIPALIILHTCLSMHAYVHPTKRMYSVLGG